MEVCFVCIGNTCRSPMAERIARKKARKLGMKDIKFSSCGLSAKGSNLATNSALALKKLGYDSRNRKSVKLKKAKNGVLYVTMDDEIKKYVNADKVISCSQLFEAVPDPYGQNEEVYFSTCKLIEKNVDVLLSKINNIRGVE